MDALAAQKKNKTKLSNRLINSNTINQMIYIFYRLLKLIFIGKIPLYRYYFLFIRGSFKKYFIFCKVPVQNITHFDWIPIQNITYFDKIPVENVICF